MINQINRICILSFIVRLLGILQIIVWSNYQLHSQPLDTMKQSYEKMKFEQLEEQEPVIERERDLDTNYSSSEDIRIDTERSPVEVLLG